jgi:small subunit ribosomal protein S6e
MEFKVVISDPSTGLAYQKVISGANANKLIGKKIGDIVNGTIVELPPDYELKICGGSDKDGVPMRKDIPGNIRKKILLAGGAGYKPREKGLRRKKAVRGNTIGRDIIQINMKVEKHGKIPLAEFFKEKQAQ